MRRFAALALFIVIAPVAQAHNPPGEGVVDPNPTVRNLADMVRVGSYDRVDPEITERHFPVKPERFTARNLEATNFGRPMTTREVIAEIDRRDYRSATIEELLAYGTEHPDTQRTRTIVALGSSYVRHAGERYSPYLTGHDGDRRLGLITIGPKWDSRYCFLIVRKHAAGDSVPTARTLGEMVKAGHYDVVEAFVEGKNFPVKPERFKTSGLQVIRLGGRSLSTEKVLAELDRLGLRPATIEELLAYGAAHPGEQRVYPIAALGSVWMTSLEFPLVVCLDDIEDRRVLIVHRSDRIWERDYRFLAAPK